MAELSPAAQVVLEAVNAAPHCGSGRIKAAAALRAAAKLEGIRPEPIGQCEERFGDPFRAERISERDFKLALAKATKQAQVNVERKILAIAAELRGTDTP